MDAPEEQVFDRFGRQVLEDHAVSDEVYASALAAFGEEACWT